MKKRYTKKRTFRKRKSFRRRRTFRRRSANNYDGVLCCKIHGTADITHSTVSTHADFTVNWAGNGIAGGAGGTARVTVANEFTTFTQLYTEYRVVGCKVAIHPLAQATNVSGSAIFNMWVGSDSNTMPGSGTADNQLASYCDYKVIPLSRPSKFYFNVGKYYAKRDIKWEPVT